ncbi:MAG TPA: hypothetical protein VKB76_09420, partial [Ktedonobacterales bacterium]|nr:hypothetical protein [Ktedonobacterales bacterium]
MAEAKTVMVSTIEKATVVRHLGGALLLCTASCAVGLWVLALADNAARFEMPQAYALFWIGLLCMIVPISVREFLPSTSRNERIILLVVLGISLYLVKVYEYPIFFTFFDEFLHWLTAQNIANSHHLFQTNSLLPISPFYPGLEMLTNALSSITGLSVFAAGTVVGGVARLILILALFLLFEMISSSSRIAGIGVLIYVTSPHFLFFDSQYAYETLAIPLAILTLFALVGTIRGSLGNRLGSMVVVWLCLAAVVVTHHVTSYILIGFIIIWALVALIRRRRPLERNVLGLLSLLGIQLVIFWLAYAGTIVLGYLSPYVFGAVQEITQLIARDQPIRPLFVDASGQVAPLWERLTATGTTALLLLLLPFALWQIWNRHRSDSLTFAFSLGALLYPASIVLRLTDVGGELASRLSTLLYIPLAYTLARGLMIYQADLVPRWLPQFVKRTFIRLQERVLAVPARLQQIVLVSGTAFIFVGGVISGGGPTWSRLPGPYLVAADQRSVDAEGIDAATWTQHYLGTHNRVATDQSNQVLMGTYGQQDVVTEIN